MVDRLTRLRYDGSARALTTFLMNPSGAQMVANLWKVLETARAYEAAAPATLRAFVRFLQDEEASSRAEGDSSVGESIGASVEIVTADKAKGSEYPIVIVADLLTDKLAAGDCIIDHAAKRGWLEIGPFRPDGWKERSDAEALQQDAEGRRLLYVALTRARPPRHSVFAGRQGRELAQPRREHALSGTDVEPVERMLRLPLMDEAPAATKLIREVSLAGNAAAGRAQGKADLLFERGGSGELSSSRPPASTVQTRCENMRHNSRGTQLAWLMS